MNRIKRHVKGRIGAIKLAVVIFIIAIISVPLVDFAVKLTSSNAVLYFVRSHSGWIEVQNDLSFEESERLLFMVNASAIYDRFLQGRAVARGEPVIETTWDEKSGRGVIKEFRADGTKFLVTLSRYKEAEGSPHGLFIGGDLAYGDTDRDDMRNNSGIAHYDGIVWHHIWCAMNEGLYVKGFGGPFFSEDWKYMGSRLIKSTSEEVIIESTHELVLEDNRLTMVRTISKEAGTEFIVLKVKFINNSESPLIYNYSIGDEPWLGDYASSSGDVGWTEGRLIKYESFISPVRNRYAGFADIGNDAIGEKMRYTGIANFVEWLNTPPSLVYFSNDFDFAKINEKRPLESYNNRIINLAWLQQSLFPGDSRTYLLALGMAQMNKETWIPEKPVVRSADSFRVE